MHKDGTAYGKFMASGGQANNINKCVNVFVYIKKGLSLQRIPSLQGDMAFVMMASKLGAPYLTHSRCLRNLTSSISHLPHWPERGCGDETHEKTKERKEGEATPTNTSQAQGVAILQIYPSFL